MAARALGQQKRFKVDDAVVYPACGIGRVAALVTKHFQGTADKQYYEVVIDRSTVWVAVDAAPDSGLRRLTLKTELGHYRAILRSRPTKLLPDARQRKQAMAERLKAGAFQATCEVVRDLTALSWGKALNDADALTLRKTRDELYQEWAAADAVPLAQAVEEVNALLLENRQAHAA